MVEGKRTEEAASSCRTNICYMSTFYVCHFNTIITVHPAVENLDMDVCFIFAYVNMYFF
jgi:hypothetical protein